jgi:hypothetical protein
VLDETERRGRRRRLIIILVVAGVILGGFLVYGRLRNSALADRANAAKADLLPQWRNVDLAELSQSYNDATLHASETGDYSSVFKAFPSTDDATFVNADLNRAGVARAAYSLETGVGGECLLVVVHSPVPNRVTFDTSNKGC